MQGCWYAIISNTLGAQKMQKFNSTAEVERVYQSDDKRQAAPSRIIDRSQELRGSENQDVSLDWFSNASRPVLTEKKATEN